MTETPKLNGSSGCANANVEILSTKVALKPPWRPPPRLVCSSSIFKLATHRPISPSTNLHWKFSKDYSWETHENFIMIFIEWLSLKCGKNHTLDKTRSKPFASCESKASNTDFINFAAAVDRLPVMTFQWYLVLSMYTFIIRNCCNLEHTRRKMISINFCLGTTESIKSA